MAIFGSKETTGIPVGETSMPVPSPVSGAGVSRLGEGILITGKVQGNETLRVDGRVEGEIDLKGDLILGPKAQVRATVHAKSIMVEGSVSGDLSADLRIELVRTARVEGTITAPNITVAEGARFEGKIDMSMRKGATQ